MSNSHSPQWRTLGVITSAMSTHRNPMAAMVNCKKGTRELSFQFGLLKNGRIQPLRFWTENMLYDVAFLSKHLATVTSLGALAGKEVTAEILKNSVDESAFLRWVNEYVPAGHKKKPSMTLGERARRV